MLSEQFMAHYKNKQPKWGPLGYYVFKRTYSRNGEEFWQTCQRVVEGIFKVLSQHAPELATEAEAENMYRRMFAFKFLPSGRSLWMMGTDGFEDIVPALYSCSFNTTRQVGVLRDITKPIVQWPAIEPFCWMMRALMNGIGGASDVRGANNITIQEPSMKCLTFVIPDTREGWVTSVAYLLAAFFYGDPLPKFSYNLIRAKGEPLKRFGGVASGPEPLQVLHRGITSLLKDNVTKGLSGALIADIYNMIGKCVVSGNIRRAAELLIGDLNDDEFINLKADKDKVMDYRWASNNSILAGEDTDFDKVVALNLQGTDLGLLFLNNARAFGRTGDYIFDDVIGYNACGELPLSNMELCNLVSIIISNAASREDFIETCRVAYLYAKTLTLMPLGWTETDAIIKKNRRLGISLTGIADFIGAHGMDELVQWSDLGYRCLKCYDKDYSKTLGINESIKLTTIKPDGTLSLLTGSSSGIHYPFAPYYIRRVRTAANSPLVKEMQDAGYQTEVDLYSPDTINILFAVRHKNYIPTPSIAEQFKLLATMQRYWADNAISITLQYKPEEASELATLLRNYSQVIKGISFFPARDEQYAQAPLEAISRRKYYELNKTDVFDVESSEEGERYCTKDSCII